VARRLAWSQCSQSPTIKRIGRVPTLVLCSRNARPQKGGIGSHQTILLARRTRTMRLCSSEARSEGQSGDSLVRGVMVQRRIQRPSLDARSGRSISPHP
jgi:hypothetical protein